jgi:predicted methyltransferase
VAITINIEYLTIMIRTFERKPLLPALQKIHHTHNNKNNNINNTCTDMPFPCPLTLVLSQGKYLLVVGTK